MNDLHVYQSHLQTRWASPENWRGEKGGACCGNDGRKRSPCFALKAGASRTLAEVNGSSGMIRRIWMTDQVAPGSILTGRRTVCRRWRRVIR